MKKLILTICLIATTILLFAADTLAPAVTKVAIDSTMAVSGARFLQALMSADLWSRIAIWGGVLFVISEGLAMIPVVKANSVFQFIFNILKWVFSKNK